MCEKRCYCREKVTFHLELVGLSRNGLTDTDDHLNAFVLKQLCYVGVKIYLVASTLQNVRQDDHIVLVLVLMAHHVQGDRQ